MNKLFKTGFLFMIICGIMFQLANAYDFPRRKIEVKPYLNIFFPSDLWETTSQPSIVENKASFGLGLKLRTQFGDQFGFVLNTAYNRFQVPDGVSSEGAILTGGGYYEKSFNFGDMTFELGYGIIIAADDVLGLLMPALEYSRPVSERMSIALELGLPIPNDWPKNFEFKENLGSFTLSVGTKFLF